MIPDIAKLVERAQTQIRMGISHAQRGDFIAAESWLLPAQATLSSLLALLDAEPVKPPLRKLCIVGTVAVPHDPELPDWFERTSGEDPDAA